MKVCIISIVSITNSFADAFRVLGWETIEYNPIDDKNFFFKDNFSGYLNDLLFIRNYYSRLYFKKINIDTFRFLENKKFDLIIVYNNSKLLPETLKRIRDNLKCPVVCFAADDPTLTLLKEHYLESMFGFSHVITFDSTTSSRIQKYSSPKIINLPGGFNPKIFYPIKNIEVIPEQFVSTLAYSSSSNQGNSFGLYRGAILNEVSQFGLKIIGDAGWYRIAKTFPSLRDSIEVRYLSLKELNQFYNACKIFISVINPSLIAGVPLRVFEIAGAGGFQIAEYKEDFKKWFPNDEIETFKTIPELKEKVKWYLDNSEARKEKAKKAYEKVLKNYKWTDVIQDLLNFLFK